VQGGYARFSRLWVAILLTLPLSGCQKPTALTFRIAAPTNPLLDPFQLTVSDFVLKGANGSTVAAVSAGADRDDKGRLGLGVLDPLLAGELRLDVLSGAQLVGSARVHQVSIDKGNEKELVADVRKPLVLVGVAAAAEASGPKQRPQLLDPTTSTELVGRGLAVPEGMAASFTSDGRSLLVASSNGLSIFDTGNGQSIGPSSLPFAPSLLALAPDDRAVALVERGTSNSRVLIYADVPSLLTAPGSATAVTASIGSGLPRAAHFSPDGSTLYVLTESAGSEPCTGPVPTTNQIVPIAANGTVATPIMMPSYVADFAVDSKGRLVLAEAGTDQVSILTLASVDGAGAGPPEKIYSASCPTALRLLEDQVFVVTNDTTTGASDAFALVRGRLDGSTPTKLPIARPIYQTQLNMSSTRDKLTRLNLEFVSTGVAATEMAVSPDGSRAVLATRVRYRETDTEPFDFVGLTCKAKVDIVEYGLYSVDLVAGTASYTSRSQNTIIPADPANEACVSCEADLGGFPPVIVTLDLVCPPTPGDRAAGLAAAFTEAP
jgi:hypothetical protein